MKKLVSRIHIEIQFEDINKQPENTATQGNNQSCKKPTIFSYEVPADSSILINIGLEVENIEIPPSNFSVQTVPEEEFIREFISNPKKQFSLLEEHVVCELLKKLNEKTLIPFLWYLHDQKVTQESCRLISNMTAEQLLEKVERYSYSRLFTHTFSEQFSEGRESVISVATLLAEIISF